MRTPEKNYNDLDNEFIKIGLNIAYYIKLYGITQLELAEKIGISRTHISNIEAPNKSTHISLETLFLIADALDIKPYLLLKFPS